MVRDFGGGGGGGRGGLEDGIGGRGLARGRDWWPGKPRPRFEGLGSVGEPAGETLGESGPLAVFALRLGPPGDGAESKLGLLVMFAVFMLGYRESAWKLLMRELLGESMLGTSFRTMPLSLVMSSVPLCSSLGRANCDVAASMARGECARPARGDRLL